jgi:diaminohydroxyphosphoribosylaminopyrimidine deaminase / 5-amino-6-(5-phosphoribosylamino)uracil reductase
VVAGGVEVATGYHRRLGEAHAEVAALEAAGARARGATLYVNLEPCTHHGRTPPCVDRIVEAGVARVVIPALDPDERVCGRGAARLRERGIAVDVGCDAAPAILDNLAYYHDRLSIPGTVTLKIATSADGMVTRVAGRRDEVTGEAVRRDVHALRALHDAVAVGVETALVDRPRLDCRFAEGGVDRTPVPVVFDAALRLPPENVWSRDGREFVVVTGEEAAVDRARAIEARGGRVLVARRGAGGLDVADAVAVLARAGYARLLVEGGPRLMRSFVAAGAWDAWWWYTSKERFGGGVPLFDTGAGAAPGPSVDECAVGTDTRRRYVNAHAWDRVTRLLAERGR